MHRSVPLCTLHFFVPQMALAYRLDAISQGPKNSRIPEDFGPVPEIIDPVFAKTSQNARFLLSENERFGLVFVKTGSINSGTGVQGSNLPSRMGSYL
jgi:hypothetical protein